MARPTTPVTPSTVLQRRVVALRRAVDLFYTDMSLEETTLSRIIEAAIGVGRADAVANSVISMQRAGSFRCPVCSSINVRTSPVPDLVECSHRCDDCDALIDSSKLSETKDSL